MNATTDFITLNETLTATTNWETIGNLSLNLPPTGATRQTVTVLFNIPTLIINNYNNLASVAFNLVLTQGRGQPSSKAIAHSIVSGFGKNFYTTVSIQTSFTYSDPEGTTVYVQWIGPSSDEGQVEIAQNDTIPSATLTAIITSAPDQN